MMTHVMKKQIPCKVTTQIPKLNVTNEMMPKLVVRSTTGEEVCSYTHDILLRII